MQLRVSHKRFKAAGLDRHSGLRTVPTFTISAPLTFERKVSWSFLGLDYGRNWPWIEPKKHCSTERSRNPAARGLTRRSPISSHPPIIPRKELIELICRLCINKYLIHLEILNRDQCSKRKDSLYDKSVMCLTKLADMQLWNAQALTG